MTRSPLAGRVARDRDLGPSEGRPGDIGAPTRLLAGADLLANVERPPSDRPPGSFLPVVPDRVSVEPPWHGGAAAYVETWRQRALRAEALLERLRAGLAAGWRPSP